jgi:hypothetical protein
VTVPGAGCTWTIVGGASSAPFASMQIPKTATKIKRSFIQQMRTINGVFKTDGYGNCAFS